jgi:hypothetical protein
VARTIKTSIDIGASPEMVWRVLSNFAAYPKWNPFIREIRGEARPGARLRVRLRLPGGRSMRFAPRVIKAIPAAELHWRGRFLVKGLFDGEHAFIIVPDGVRGVRFVQREHFSGLLAPLILLLRGARIREGFERMNLALKKQAEGRR